MHMIQSVKAQMRLLHVPIAPSAILIKNLRISSFANDNISTGMVYRIGYQCRVDYENPLIGDVVGMFLLGIDPKGSRYRELQQDSDNPGLTDSESERKNTRGDDSEEESEWELPREIPPGKCVCHQSCVHCATSIAQNPKDGDEKERAWISLASLNLRNFCLLHTGMLG